ncbi:unnamed protein product [Penicillium pancosmium]
MASLTWFLEQGMSKQNNRYVNFISALEAICETLERKTANPPSQNAQQSHSPLGTEAEAREADVDLFLSRFSVLTVEEQQESQEQGQSISPVSQNLVKVELGEHDGWEATEPDSDQVFKVFSLFHDFRNMREFISNIWLGYREKKIDHINAAIVTDSALQLAQDLAKELEYKQDALGTTNKSLQLFIFSQHAILCGLHISYSNVQMQLLGESLVTHWYDVKM